MRHPLVWDFPRILVPILVLIGIVTGALNKTFGGFTPIMWFLLALADLLFIICGEVLTIRIMLEGREQSRRVREKQELPESGRPV